MGTKPNNHKDIQNRFPRGKRVLGFRTLFHPRAPPNPTKSPAFCWCLAGWQYHIASPRRQTNVIAARISSHSSISPSLSHFFFIFILTASVSLSFDVHYFHFNIFVLFTLPIYNCTFLSINIWQSSALNSSLLSHHEMRQKWFVRTFVVVSKFLHHRLKMFFLSIPQILMFSHHHFENKPKSFPRIQSFDFA